MLTSNYSHRFRSTRHKNVRTPTEKLVSFELSGEWYGLSIHKVLRVIKDFTPHGSLQSGRSLVESNGELIPTIDPTILFNTVPDTRSHQYLIICNLSATPATHPTSSLPHRSDRLGIPIPEMPTIVEVSQDQFEAVPTLYRQGVNGTEMAPASLEKVVRLADGKMIFYLNIDQLNLTSSGIVP